MAYCTQPSIEEDGPCTVQEMVSVGAIGHCEGSRSFLQTLRRHVREAIFYNPKNQNIIQRLNKYILLNYGITVHRRSLKIVLCLSEYFPQLRSYGIIIMSFLPIWMPWHPNLPFLLIFRPFLHLCSDPPPA